MEREDVAKSKHDVGLDLFMKIIFDSTSMKSIISKKYMSIKDRVNSK